MRLNEFWQSSNTSITNVKVYDVKANEKPLYDFGLFGGWKGVNLCVKEGTDIQAEFKFGETTQRSPVYKP
jgi:hypothetical protein